MKNTGRYSCDNSETLRINYDYDDNNNDGVITKSGE